MNGWRDWWIAGIVLARIARLIFKDLDQSVKENSEESSKPGPNPIDPMGPVKLAHNDVRAKRTSRVEGATGPIDA
jgi:hypothetical protein